MADSDGQGEEVSGERGDGNSNKANDAMGTYAMAAYAQDISGREFVVIITVAQRSNQNSNFEMFELIHSVSGRQKRGGIPVDTKSQGVNLSTYASKVSIRDFLAIVKDVYRSAVTLDLSDYEKL